MEKEIKGLNKTCDNCRGCGKKQYATHYCGNCLNVFCDECAQDAEWGCPFCAPPLMEISKKRNKKKN